MVEPPSPRSLLVFVRGMRPPIKRIPVWFLEVTAGAASVEIPVVRSDRSQRGAPPHAIARPRSAPGRETAERDRLQLYDDVNRGPLVCGASLLKRCGNAPPHETHPRDVPVIEWLWLVYQDVFLSKRTSVRYDTTRLSILSRLPCSWRCTPSTDTRSRSVETLRTGSPRCSTPRTGTRVFR